MPQLDHDFDHNCSHPGDVQAVSLRTLPMPELLLMFLEVEMSVLQASTAHPNSFRGNSLYTEN